MNFNRAVILHGKPAAERLKEPSFNPSRANYLGWLADSLQGSGLRTVSPVNADPGNPNFEDYKRQLEQIRYFIRGRGRRLGLSSSSNAAIFAHSAAAGPALEWAFEDGFEGAIVVAAPWVDLSNEYLFMRQPFQGYSASDTMRLKCFGRRVAIVSSSDDNQKALDSFEWLVKKLPGAIPVEVEGFGHFVTGNNLKPDYDLGNGLVGSTCPLITRTADDL